MPRERLPDRRQAETVDLHYGGQRFHLTIGEYDDGRPGEVFVHGATVGSDVDGLCGDVGVLISRLLQFGDDPASLALGMCRRATIGLRGKWCRSGAWIPDRNR